MFVIHSSVPVAVVPDLERHLLPLVWMIPAWCQRVNVLWQAADEADDEGAALYVRVNFEYRYAELYVKPLWLEARAEIKRDNCVHEMVHLHLNPAFDYCYALLEKLITDQPLLLSLVREQLVGLVEGVTQDLTDTIMRRLAEKETNKTADAAEKV